jgi:hypothetical protein
MDKRRAAPYIWILSAFAVSRILYWLAGVRFQTHLITFNFQFIDVALLKDRLAESLFYYHMQPPLMNLVLGVLVKAFPSHYAEALHVLYMAFGAFSAVLLFQLMRRLDVGVRLACLLTILFIVSPASILFENYPMYEYLELALLLAQCLALARLLERPSFWSGFLFFSLLATLALMRSFYHLYYLLAVAAALAVYLRPRARIVAAAAALPILIVFALYAKNLALFGVFGSSSWLGNNLPTVTTHQLTVEECQSLVRSGKLDPFGCVEGGLAPRAYLPWVSGLKPSGIPVLDEEVKSTGEGNYNHQVYLKTGPMFARVAEQVLRYYPVAYLRSVLIAWFCYFRPASDFFQFEENRAPIHALDRAYNVLLSGQLREASNPQLRAIRAAGGAVSLALYTGIFLMVGFPAILLATGWFWIRDYRRKTMPVSAARPANQLVLIAFVVLQIVLVALIANFLSSFENNRYRFPTDPLYVALAGALVAKLLRHFGLSRELAA